MFETRIEGLEGVLKTLESLPQEVVSKRGGGPVAAAARDALKPMREDAKANVRAIVAQPNEGGEPSESTGLLEKSIRISRRRFDEAGKGEKYALRVGRKKYPNSEGSKGKKSRTTIKVGALLEYGTEHMTAKPWIRPAYEKNRQGALRIFTQSINKRLEKIVKKLERQNGVA